MTRPQDAATEALAEALAGAEREHKEFRRGQKAKTGMNRRLYGRYMETAVDLRIWLEAAGYVIRKARKSG